MLYDQHGRVMNYMRLAVTDRCNLRCQYCMPECGIDFTSRSDLLTYEEMLRVVRIFAEEGVEKIRITGGEPFVRKDLMEFLTELNDVQGVKHIHMTTNGTLLEGKLEQLRQLGITSINLSLDSLDRQRFFEITRRDELDLVMSNLRQMMDMDFDVKINMVVMSNKNTDDIISMLEFAKENPVSVRFLEEMPFNGVGIKNGAKFWSHIEILDFIKSNFPLVKKIEDRPHSTSMNYSIDGFKGDFGIIASYSRTFCGSCNRIRVTPQGMLQTCLYDGGVFNLRDLIRAGASNIEILNALKSALSHRAIDGYEAENRRSQSSISESMASIGG